jgi:predicted phosphodiesterase
LRLAIISDIHSNLPALEAALEAIDRSDLEEIWCLGDVVGYGAQPDDCSTLVAERCSQCLVGNHDLAVLGELDVSAFSPAAAAAVQWTRRTGSPDTMKFLRGLKPAEEGLEVGLYHGSPRDPIWEYVLTTEQAEECLERQAARVSLIGHSHVALYFSDTVPEKGPAEGAESVIGAQAPAGTALEVGEGRWLINPGSVGQPRDGDPRAAWLELDTGHWTVTYHRLDYEIDRAASAIVAAGLPEQLAQRLYVGL